MYIWWIGAEGERPPAEAAGQVRPRRRSRGGSPPAPRSRSPVAEINQHSFQLATNLK
jgi:hypothetical protein